MAVSLPIHPDKDTSITLMMRIQQDPADSQAWNEFVDRYRPMIRDWCLKWGAQETDSDDVAQQVLLKLLTAMNLYRREPGCTFRGWLRTVTRNAWLDLVNSRRPGTGHSPDQLEVLADSRDALADLENQMENAFERELLDLAMDRVKQRVKPMTWQAFELTFAENLSGAQAAERLGLQISHVFVAKHRVLKLLEEEARKLKTERG